VFCQMGNQPADGLFNRRHSLTVIAAAAIHKRDTPPPDCRTHTAASPSDIAAELYFPRSTPTASLFIFYSDITPRVAARRTACLWMRQAEAITMIFSAPATLRAA